MSERLAAAYEQVAHEVERLVLLFQESQENQQLFMTEAYRLLQAQSREVGEMRDRVTTAEEIHVKLDQILDQLGTLSTAAVPTRPLDESSPSPYDAPPEPEQDTAGGGAHTGIGAGTETTAPQTGPTAPGADTTPETGATSGTTTPPGAETTPPQEEDLPVKQAAVRFLHAATDAPHVDVLVDGRKVASDVSYQGVSPYLPLSPGRHRIQVFPAGVSVGALVDTTTQIKPNTHYTVAIAGTQRNLRSVVIEDSPRGAKKGFARLKVVHLSPNAPAIDVTLPSGKVLLGHLTYKQKSPYLQVTPGQRTLKIRFAGKTEEALTLPPFLFDPDITYSLYVVGKADGEPPLAPLLLPEA